VYNPMISKEELGKSLVFQPYVTSLGERKEVSFLELILSPTLTISSRLRAFFYFGEPKAIIKVLRAWDLLERDQVVKDREEALRYYYNLSTLISEVANQSLLEVSGSIKVPEDMRELVLGSLKCTFIENLNLSIYNTAIVAIFSNKMPINYRLN
jgi:hypothetical protein